jgi:hypothetical protein
MIMTMLRRHKKGAGKKFFFDLGRGHSLEVE